MPPEIEEQEVVELPEGEGADAEALAEEVAEDEQGEAQAEAEEELVVTIGDDPPEEDQTAGAAPWVKELRRSHREAQKRIRELEEQANRLKSGGAADVPVVGKKPTIEDCDYDTEEFEKKLTAWYDQKRSADEAAAKVKQAQEAEQAAWQEQLKQYGESKASLKVQDFEDAESAVLEAFNTTQQGIVVKGADNSALVVYALGKNPKKLKELAAITDPVKFSFAVARLELQVKQTKRTAPPPPERQVSGSGGKAGAIDNQLDRLRAEAEKTGDMTKLLAYKRQKRA